MKRLYLIALCLYMACSGATATTTKELSADGISKASKASSSIHAGHKNHKRVGSHGMVLFTDGAELYASHLPLYYSPHDYQLVYTVGSPHKAKLIAYLQADSMSYSNMVTLLPENFDLNKLVDGEKFSISAQFYKGHFERGGTKWLGKSELTFEKLLFKRRLVKQYKPPHSDEDSVKDNLDEKWTRVSLGDKHLYIHLIGERPSFDALFIVDDCQTTLENKQGESVPSKAQINEVFSHCGSPGLVYFETQDFAY
ncbi:MAG: hypothetical protein SVW51_01385 [Pseudomonadota bacterium]|nr:hypothetical protein [Pseudomonadota bacterium]